MITKIQTLNLIIKLFLLLKSSVVLQELRPTVTLSQGIVVGVKVYLPRVTVNAFLGIPYAEPPIGPLRFAIPERHKGWPGPRFASNYGHLCPYYISNTDMSDDEDCLYLNVWTTNQNGSQPVMVYLSSDPVQIPGHNLAAEGVVLVSINYRQNIFGSLCLGSPEARGNLGLLDQYMALIWIRDNIDKFGGDKNSVTLIGHSSSAASVIYHLTSPRARGLFTKGIVMSGNAYPPWNNVSPIAITQSLRSDLGCMTATVQSALECLRSKSVLELLHAFGRHVKDNTWSILPVVDTFLSENDRYLPADPYDTLTNGSYLQIPLIIGSSDFLNDHVEQQDKPFPQLKNQIEENFIMKLVRLYKFDGPNKNFIKTTIIWKYLGSVANDDMMGLHMKMHDLHRDSKILAPNERLLKSLVKTIRFPVYSYFLQMSKVTKNISDLTYVGTELLLLFGPQLLKPYARRRFTFAEERLSSSLKLSLVAFAKKGNPSITEYDDQWRPYNSVNKHIQQFGDENNLTEYRSVISFWNELLPKVSNMLSQTNSIPQEYQVSPDPAAGFRQAMYTLVGLVVALLILLLICIVLLKRKVKERKGHFGTYN